jgi:multiple sugar transport system substrate-binding protein
MKYEKMIYIVIGTIIIIAVLLVSYLFPLFSYNNNINSKVTTIYFADNISAAHQKLIDNFNDRYRGQLKVEAIDLPFEKFSTNERKELLARYLRSKSERIDLFSVDQIWGPRFAKWGVSFDKYFTPLQKSKLLSYALESCYYKDSLLAIPLYIDIALMYYRKDIINQLPDSKKIKEQLERSITWEELIELNSQINNQKNPLFTFQADDYEGLVCIFAELMASQNKPMAIDDSLQLHTPEAEKALQLLVDLVNKYKISPKQVTYLKENPSYKFYIENNGILLRGWPSFGGKDNVILMGNREAFENLEMAPTPHFRGYSPTSVYGGWNLMISKYSSKIPEVLKFVNYLISEEAQKILYEEGSYLPINNDVYNDTAFVNANPRIKYYQVLLSRGFHRPFLEDYTNISDVLSYYIKAAIKKELTVKEALAEASRKINSENIFLK